MSEDFKLPEGKRERDIAQVICRTIEEWQQEPPDGGGSRAFYTPEEWKARGERYGQEAALIVVHDGGDAARFFNLDYESYGAIETMERALEEIGFYAEACTSWYTAIYPST